MKYTAYHYSLKNLEIYETIPCKVYNNLQGRKNDLEKKLEEVRQQSFSNHHTRLNCVFIAPSENCAIEWCRSINIMHWRNEGKQLEFYVYKVEVKEDIVWYDSEIIMDNYDRFDIEIANNYWRSGTKFDDIKNDHLYEAMVSGDVTIVNKTKFIITPKGNVHKINN